MYKGKYCLFEQTKQIGFSTKYRLYHIRLYFPERFMIEEVIRQGIVNDIKDDVSTAFNGCSGKSETVKTGKPLT